MGLSVEDLSRDLSKYESILKYLSGFTLDGRNISPVNHTLLMMLDDLCEVSENEKIKKLNMQLTKKDKLIAELEQELAELKEKAIARPKFEHFEEYWYIENNPYCDNELQVFNGKVMEIICAYDEDWLYEYRFDTSCRYIEEDNIFATEQEAQAKLQELRGRE